MHWYSICNPCGEQFTNPEAWHAGNVVLVGDAVHTAHWSIGSGTRLALEDAVALARAFVKHRDRDAAIAEYELERQPVVERLQDASRVSCGCFQSLTRYFGFEPLQSTYQLMTRTPRVTHTNATVRDPDFVRHDRDPDDPQARCRRRPRNRLVQLHALPMNASPPRDGGQVRLTAFS